MVTSQQTTVCCLFFCVVNMMNLCRSIHSGTLQAPSFLGGRTSTICAVSLWTYECKSRQWFFPDILESWFCTNLLISEWLVSGNYGVHNPSKPWFLAKLWNGKTQKMQRAHDYGGSMHIERPSQASAFFIGAFHHRCQGHVGKSMIRLRREKNGENWRFPFRVSVTSKQVGDPNSVGHRTIEIRVNNSGLTGEGV